MKKLIAYSSVAHMGFVTMGIFAGNEQGIQGAIFQMLSHGVISGALFLCVGVVYDRMHTREIAFYGGLVNRMPGTRRSSCCSPWATSACRAPRGFVGEILTMTGVYQASTWTAPGRRHRRDPLGGLRADALSPGRVRRDRPIRSSTASPTWTGARC